MAAAQDTIGDLDDWQKDDPDYVDWIQEPERILKNCQHVSQSFFHGLKTRDPQRGIEWPIRSYYADKT
tara:strand:+ start:516 stop:719 length:204 start_codon:yes stop_codon:yes gene_type:complete